MTYLDMIIDAIKALKYPQGSSRFAIKKYIVANNSNITFMQHCMTKAINKGIEQKKIIKISESFKVFTKHYEQKQIVLCKKQKQKKQYDAQTMINYNSTLMMSYIDVIMIILLHNEHVGKITKHVIKKSIMIKNPNIIFSRHWFKKALDKGVSENMMCKTKDSYRLTVKGKTYIIKKIDN